MEGFKPLLESVGVSRTTMCQRSLPSWSCRSWSHYIMLRGGVTGRGTFPSPLAVCCFIVLLLSSSFQVALTQAQDTPPGEQHDAGGGGDPKDSAVQQQQRPVVNTSSVPPLEVVQEASRPLLTPYWSPLVFSVNETAVVDCGVFTGGQPESVIIKWTKQGTDNLDEKRIQTVRRDKFVETESSPGAYSVTTLSLTDLQASDSGVYVCSVTKTSDNSVTTANFTLTVMDPVSRCGFEESMCGWSGTPEWHLHTGGDDKIINRTKQGALFDHTYGSSKHIGHFMDVDIRHLDNVNSNTTARLTSPTIGKHQHNKILQFWYIFEGRDKGSLRVLLHNVTASEERVSVVWSVSEDVGPEWQRACVPLPPNSADYHIILEVDLCMDTCRLAATSVDDISISDSSSCEHAKWPDNPLKVRLVDGSSPWEGRVELLHDGQWGSVCSEDFGKSEAKVICNALGYSDDYAEKCRNAHFGQSPPGSVIWLERLACSKNNKERDLASCLIPGETWGTSECQHADDAGVICSDVPVTCTSSLSTPRLSSTVSKSTADVLRSTSSPTIKGGSVSSKSDAVNEHVTPTPGVQNNGSHPETQTVLPPPHRLTDTPIAEGDKQDSNNSSITQQPQVVVSASSLSTVRDVSAPSAVTPSPNKNATVATPRPVGTTTTNATAVLSNGTTKIMPQPTKLTPMANTNMTKTSKAPVVKSGSNMTSSPMSKKPDHTTSLYVLTDPPHSKSHAPTQQTRPSTSSEATLPDVALLPSGAGSNAGVAIGIILGVLIAALGVGVLLYRRKRKGKKSTYITFGNPSYSREHLPANDFSLESPLTLSSNGYTVLA